MATRSIRYPRPAPARTRRQQQTRLREDQALGLVADYQAGATVDELAATYDVHPQTVSQILRRHGVAMRFRSLSADEAEEAARLYQTGLSLVAVGERLGFSDRAIWTALHRGGVTMRPRRGGQKRST